MVGRYLTVRSLNDVVGVGHLCSDGAVLGYGLSGDCFASEIFVSDDGRPWTIIDASESDGFGYCVFGYDLTDDFDFLDGDVCFYAREHAHYSICPLWLMVFYFFSKAFY